MNETAMATEIPAFDAALSVICDDTSANVTSVEADDAVPRAPGTVDVMNVSVTRLTPGVVVIVAVESGS